VEDYPIIKPLVYVSLNVDEIKIKSMKRERFKTLNLYFSLLTSVTNDLEGIRV